MKNRKGMGGISRLVILIIVLAAAFAGIRLAVGRISSGRAKTEAAEQISSTETVSAAGSSAQETAAPISLSSESTGAGADGAPAASADAGGAADESAVVGGSGAADVSVSADVSTAADGDISVDENLSPDGSLTASGGADSAAASTEEEKPAYDHEATELENGREYLASLEARTPVEMEYMISLAQKEHEKELKIEAYRQKREEYRESLDGDHVWEAFEDYVFLGDSRVVGYDVFGFLSSDRVLAESGDTINSITNRMDSIKSLSPKYIFISYGINDIGIGFWPTAEEYAAALSEKLHELQKELPDAEIYVNSIIPARDDAAQIYTIWQGLPEYSEAVRLMCEKEGFAFIDNTSIIEEHADLYAADGVHMQPDFYRYWAENQLLGIYDRKNGVLTF